MFTEEQIIRGRQLLSAQLGKKYIFGYEVKLADPDPIAFDCSELVQWFYSQMGYSIADGSYNQFELSDPVAETVPFDLGFWAGESGVYHVCLTFDKESVIHAKNSRVGVVMDPIARFVMHRDFAGWRRPTCLSV